MADVAKSFERFRAEVICPYSIVSSRLLPSRSQNATMKNVGPAVPDILSLLPNSPEMILRADKNRPIHHTIRRQRPLPQIIFRQQLKRLPRLHHKSHARLLLK